MSVAITQKIKRTHTLPGLTGPLTARQAFTAVERLATQHDRGARLVLASGQNINWRGHASAWEFFYLLPNRRVRAVFSVSLCDDEVAAEPETNCLTEQITPFPAPGDMLDQLLRSGALTQAALNDAWARELAGQPALPLPFRDSPEVVQALTEQGADFVAGSTSLSLTGVALPTGEAVWNVYHYDVEYQTPFAASE